MVDIVSTVSPNQDQGSPSNPGAGPGQFYATLAAWEAGEQTNLVSAGDTHTVECYNGDYGNGVDGGLVDGYTLVSAWTTSATNNITITTPESERFTGANDGFALVGQTTTAMIRSDVGYLDIIGLRFRLENAAGANQGFLAFTNGSKENLVDKCYFVTNGASGGGAGTYQGIDHDDTSGAFVRLEVRNSVFDRIFNVNFPSTPDCIGIRQAFASGEPKSFINNCTIYQASNGIRDCTVENTVSFGNSVADFQSCTFTANNAASDGTAAGTGAINDISTADGVDFTAPSTSDFMPVASPGKLDGAGTDLSVSFTDDINSNTRVAPWEIGAYEIQAVGPTPAVLSNHTTPAFGETTATIGCTTDTAGGTLYWYLSQSNVAPTPAELKAGTNAEQFNNFTPTLGANTVDLTGLTSSTEYWHYWIQETT